MKKVIIKTINLKLNPNEELLLKWYFILLYQNNGEITDGFLRETVFLTCGELVRLNFPVE